MDRRVLTVLVHAAALLMAAGCLDQHRLLPSSADFQRALTLSSSDSSLPADGFSATKVTARLTGDVDADRRTIVLVTTAGSFIGAAAGGASIEVAADSDGTAVASLRSSRAVEQAHVTASVKTVTGLSKSIDIAFTEVDPTSQIRLVLPQASSPADGATITVVRAQIAAGLAGANRRVSFATTLGVFVPSAGAGSQDAGSKTIDQDADASNQAVVFLRSPADAIGDTFITARIQQTPSITASGTLKFTRAFPERVRVSAASASLQPAFASTTQITVTLSRDIGVPTSGTGVVLSAVDSTGKTISFFSSVTSSNSQGVVTATFTPGSTAALGPAVVTATVDGTSVSGLTTIQIIPLFAASNATDLSLVPALRASSVDPLTALRRD